MSLEPEMYVDLTISLIRGLLEETIEITHVAQLLYMAAQPTTTTETFEVTDEVKAELTDWIPDDLAGLRAVTIVQINLICIDEDHKHPEGEHTHIAQVLRLETAPGWDPRQVHANRTQLDEVIERVGRRRLPADLANHLVMSTGIGNVGLRDLLLGVKDVDAEVSDFRKELDRLFPTAEEGGRNE